jgi:hypothetical protein
MVVVNPHLLNLLQQVQSESLSDGELPFNTLISKLETISNKPSTNMVELRQKNNKKMIGDIFEDFCYLYFLIKKVDHVWTTKNIPDDLRKTLSLPQKDMGIDLIIQEKDTYSAIQVKYRKKTKKTNILSWTELSTFYASCLNTGPWKKHIVFTNCDSIHRVGRKSNKDVSICYGTLKKLTSFDLIDMINLIKPSADTIQNNTLTPDNTKDNILQKTPENTTNNISTPDNILQETLENTKDNISTPDNILQETLENTTDNISTPDNILQETPENTTNNISTPDNILQETLENTTDNILSDNIIQETLENTKNNILENKNVLNDKKSDTKSDKKIFSGINLEELRNKRLNYFDKINGSK